MKYWIAFLILSIVSVAASAQSDLSGYLGGNGHFYGGFTGRWPPLVGSVGNGGGGGGGCSGDALIFTTPCNSMYVVIIH